MRTDLRDDAYCMHNPERNWDRHLVYQLLDARSTAILSDSPMR